MTDTWINCKDEMPPKGCDVLLCSVSDIINIGFYTGSAWCIHSTLCDIKYISHWQYVPKPPKR